MSDRVSSKIQKQQLQRDEPLPVDLRRGSTSTPRQTESDESCHSGEDHTEQQYLETRRVATAAAATVDDLDVPTFDFSMFTTIDSLEQRHQYKVIFDKDFEEYGQLLEHVNGVREGFHVLNNKLLHLDKGSREYKIVELQIRAAYEWLHSADERRRKLRFDYLHAKLAHIGRLVQHFDKRVAMAEAVALAESCLRERRRQRNLSRLRGPHQI